MKYCNASNQSRCMEMRILPKQILAASRSRTTILRIIYTERRFLNVAYIVELLVYGSSVKNIVESNSVSENASTPILS